MCRVLSNDCAFEFIPEKPGWVRCSRPTCKREQRTRRNDPTCVRRANCGAMGPRIRPPRQKRGRLGTWVSIVLRKMGITRYRYTKFLVFFHLIKLTEVCGCYRRKEKLNQFGAWFMGHWDSIFHKVAA